jgi:hypothetical protein
MGATHKGDKALVAKTVDAQTNGPDECQREERHLNGELVVGNSRTVYKSQHWAQQNHDPAHKFDGRSNVAEMNLGLR